MPQLSIIVPVYNVEPYLRRCIDSILAQTFTDFELILIDDGSPDRCGEIIEEYAKRDCRIVTIHQDNKGVSAARNAGLSIARGIYIGFVDPDDWIEPEMYEKLVSAIVDNCVDLACCNVYKVEENGKKSRNTDEQIPFYLDTNQILYHIIKYPSTINGWSWNKLYRKSLIKEYFDEKLKICEDTKFVVHYCRAVQKACYIDEPLYDYYLRSTSAMYTNHGAYALGLSVKRELCAEFYEICGKQGIAELAEDDYLDSCCLCINYAQKNKDKYFKIARDEFYSYIKLNWKRILKNRQISIKKKIMIGIYLLKSI